MVQNVFKNSMYHLGWIQISGLYRQSKVPMYTRYCLFSKWNFAFFDSFLYFWLLHHCIIFCQQHTIKCHTFYFITSTNFISVWITVVKGDTYLYFFPFSGFLLVCSNFFNFPKSKPSCIAFLLSYLYYHVVLYIYIY